MDRREEQFLSAARILPTGLRQAVFKLSSEEKCAAEEFRLRQGMSLYIFGGGRETAVNTEKITQADLSMVMEAATRASAYAMLSDIRSGFVTIPGGHRLGLCGFAAVSEGEIKNIKKISSLSIRIASESTGIAKEIMPQISENGKLCGTMIVGPPGSGKTTMLRDIVRCVSDGRYGVRQHTVSVADERGEIAACFEGEPYLYVGTHTDVMTGCAKAQAMIMLIKAMNPQVLAADEITAAADAQAAQDAANCGVTLLLTAHGGDAGDLYKRDIYRELIKTGAIKKVVVIHTLGNKRFYEVKGVEAKC